MPLIASVSGIRGTIGAGEQSLNPQSIARFAAAYGTWLLQNSYAPKVVLGRDARPSGPILRNIVSATLNALGIEVLDLGMATTPTVEVAVVAEDAGGGIVLSASHNPVEWNALKLLNFRGEFLSAEDGQQILARYEAQDFPFRDVHGIAATHTSNAYLDYHLNEILNLPLVDVAAIRAAGLKVGVDAVNSIGGIYVPELLRRLGVATVVELNCEPNGQFAHNPEPLKEHLGDICALVAQRGLDLAVVVDPDVDRLALIDETGQMFGEEYTLVLVADYVLRHRKGHVVSNLSSSRALRDLAHSLGCTYSASAVGEAHVVVEMKKNQAVLGGEGNGGIIYPDLHYGRDALVGIALALTHIAHEAVPLSVLRARYPDYHMAKHKVDLRPGLAMETLLTPLQKAFPESVIDRTDGIKLDLPQGWIHLRKSNTEPILRIYTEAPTLAEAEALARKAALVLS